MPPEPTFSRRGHDLLRPGVKIGWGTLQIGFLLASLCPRTQTCWFDAGWGHRAHARPGRMRPRPLPLAGPVAPLLRIAKKCVRYRAFGC